QHVHGDDRHLEELLDCGADLSPVGIRMHLERVLVGLDEAVALLRDDRRDQDLAWGETEAHEDATSWTRARAPSVRRSDRAQTIAPTSSAGVSSTSARGRFRKDLATL